MSSLRSLAGPAWAVVLVLIAAVAASCFDLRATSTGWHVAAGPAGAVGGATFRPPIHSPSPTRMRRGWITSGGFQVLAAVADGLGGAPALIALRILVVAVLGLVLLVLLRAEGLAAAPSVALAVVGLAGARMRFFVRPELMTMLIATAVIGLALRPPRRLGHWNLAIVVVLIAAGVNLHGGVLVIPVVLAALAGWTGDRCHGFTIGTAECGPDGGRSTRAGPGGDPGQSLGVAAVARAASSRRSRRQALDPEPGVDRAGSDAAASSVDRRGRRVARSAACRAGAGPVAGGDRDDRAGAALCPQRRSVSSSLFRSSSRQRWRGCGPGFRPIGDRGCRGWWWHWPAVSSWCFPSTPASAPACVSPSGSTRCTQPAFSRTTGLLPGRIYHDVRFGGWLIGRYFPRCQVFIDDRNEILERLLHELWQIWPNRAGRTGSGISWIAGSSTWP